MKKYSKDTYILRSSLTIEELKTRVDKCTLKKRYLTMGHTNKDFIGRVHDNTFEIFPVLFLPHGALCVFQGTITNGSEIKITTTLHNAFRVLFVVWATIVAALPIMMQPSRLDNTDNLIALAVTMPIALFLFRLILHGGYMNARNQGLAKLKTLLEASA